MRAGPFCLGKIAPTAAGTPIPITTDTTLRASDLLFSPVEANTGRVVIGKTGSLNKTTLAGAIAELSQASEKFNGPLLLQDQESRNSIQLSNYCVDADVNNEGVLITYWTN